MDMTTISVEKVLNTNDSFRYNEKRYRIIGEDITDTTKWQCVVTDTTNTTVVGTIDKTLVPNTFILYSYRFKDISSFGFGKVIYLCHKTTSEVVQMNAIIIAYARNSISFAFRDTGGEIRQQMLTAQQIDAESIKLQVYPLPTES